jgi:hypothetical protein
MLSTLSENCIQNICKAVACIQKLFLEERGEVIYKLIRQYRYDLSGALYIIV